MSVHAEWDAGKNRANRRKHGVSFELVQEVFDDPLALSKPDRIEGGEGRWHTLGMVGGTVVLLVVHTVRDDKGEEVSASFRRARRAARTEAL